MPLAAGYITDTPENVYVTGKGLAPEIWWGITPPNGTTSPWASAAMGSIYIDKSSESGRPVLYMKVDTLEATSDWASISTAGRTFTGQPVGLLLTLTHS
jgi:hypothetical protein